MRGLLITFEGVEGSGKSTHCRLLADWLRSQGREVVLTSEPDGTPLGAAVRGLFEVEGVPPTPLAQTFLFMAARQQHVAQVIRPALSRGAVVISDRYADATLAYQGFGGGMDLETIRDLDAFEKMDLSFHRRVRNGYLEIARAEKSRFVVLDAAQAKDALHAAGVRAVRERLERLERHEAPRGA